jgi:hypothetical protein
MVRVERLSLRSAPQYVVLKWLACMWEFSAEGSGTARLPPKHTSSSTWEWDMRLA